MSPLSHGAELMKLQFSLGLSEKTSQLMLKPQKKTRADIRKILRECGIQTQLIDDFAQTEAFFHLNPRQQSLLKQKYENAKNIYYDLVQP